MAGADKGRSTCGQSRNRRTCPCGGCERHVFPGGHGGRCCRTMGRAWRIKHAVWLGGRCGVVRYAVYYPTCIYLHWVRSGGRAEGCARKKLARLRRKISGNAVARLGHANRTGTLDSCDCDNGCGRCTFECHTSVQSFPPLA